MNLRVIYILCYLLSLTLPLAAQQMIDVIQNKTYAISNNVNQGTTTFDLSKKNVEIVFTQIHTGQSKADEAWINNFNQASEEKCRAYLTNADLQKQVFQDLEQKLILYNQLKSNDRYHQSSEKLSYHDCSLETVQCHALGIWNKNLLCEVRLHFTVPDHYEGGIDLNYYYWVNTQQTSWELWSSSLAQISQQQTKQVFWDELTASYIHVSDKYNFTDNQYRDSTVLANSIQNVKRYLQNNIVEQEVQVLPYAWGVVLRIPALSTSSVCNRGEGWQVFIPYQRFATTIKQETRLGCLEPLLHVNTSIHHYYSFHQSLHRYGLLYQLEPEALLADCNPTRKPKQCMVKRYQRFSDTARQITNTSIYDFNGNMKLLHETILDDHNKKVSETFNEYDADGFMISSEKIEYNKLKESTQYMRDKQHNVIQVAHLQGNQYTNNFFYNQSDVYELVTENSGNLDRWYIHHGKEQQEQAGFIKLLNEEQQQQVSGLEAHRNDGSVYGYDKQGKLIESYSGDEQRSNFLVRNEQGRITALIHYYQGAVSKHCTVKYPIESALPEFIDERNYHYSDETILEYEINWEYFK